MNQTPLPSRKDFQDLTAFLPRLYAPGFQPIIRWDGGTRNAQGHIQVPYPVYAELVHQFFRVVAQDCWIDRSYIPEQAVPMLDRIETLSLPELRILLTFCLRGERFSDGHWEAMIEKGYIRRILERLQQLTEDSE
jgi:hypothetical protein